MHDTIAKMKDGTVYCGPIWNWQPLKGYCDLTTPEGLERVYFYAAQSIETEGMQISKDHIGTQNELKRAREDGWKEK